MRAFVYERYGAIDVLEMREVAEPSLGEEDVLIKVKAASLNRSDWESMTGKPLYARLNGLRRPKKQILGTDVAGEVVAVGGSVSSVQPGDDVIADTMYHGGGTFAEYVRVRESAPLVIKPAGLSFTEAAAIPQAGVIALQGVANLAEEGDRVLINGAGGGTGSFAIQMAKIAGAGVTAVDNRSKLEFMLESGADRVIDYQTTDYTSEGQKYDLILDLVCQRSMFAIRRAVDTDGRYSLVGGSMVPLLSVVTVGKLLSRHRHMGLLLVSSSKEDLSRVVDLVTRGSIKTHIDRTYTFDALPDAMARLGSDRALGKLVVAFDQS